MYSGLSVPGITAVTAGCDRMNLRNNCAQLVAPNSAAKSGSGLPADFAEQRVAAERQVDQHGGAGVARGRQQHLFGIAVAERIIDLEEIGFLARQYFGDRIILPVEARRHADVAAEALFFPFAQQAEIVIRIADVPRLHQIDAVGLEAAQRILHRCRRRLARGPVRKLGGEKKLVAHAEIGDQFADAVFGATVGVRGVDQLAAAGDERLDDLPALGEFRRVVFEIEYHRGADADDRQRLAAGGDRPRLQRFFGGRCGQQQIRQRAAKRGGGAGDDCTPARGVV